MHALAGNASPNVLALVTPHPALIDMMEGNGTLHLLHDLLPKLGAERGVVGWRFLGTQLQWRPIHQYRHPLFATPDSPSRVELLCLRRNALQSRRVL